MTAVTRFDEVLQRLGIHEGGLSLDPKDPGNWTGGKQGVGVLKGTKRGISAAAYPMLDIAALTDEDIDAIYLNDYWLKMKCPEMPAGLDEFMFDFAVNSGVTAATVALQAAVGTLRDGVIGPKTLAALYARLRTAGGFQEVLRMVFVERAMIFALNPNDKLYGRGWFARLFDKVVEAFNVRERP